MNYPVRMRVLHWLMAVLILGLLGVGFYMANLPGDAPDKYSLYPVHKAIGFIVLLLVALRILVRLSSQVPELPRGFAPWEVLLSRLVHGVLYLCMLTMALSGYLMSTLSPRTDGLSLFGLVNVPDFLGKNPDLGGIFHEIHGLCAYLFCAALLLHIAGVIKHRFFDDPDNDVLKRML